ncbi:hypothetical protein GGR53DRAFT_68921 [Hypoxylon sp. FL1150]|nr:hypothetical protein GGR53DRAFT_68921 [Hypoxylon sp. FL1150]
MLKALPRNCNQPTLNITSLPEDFGLMAAICWLYPGIIDFQGQIVNGQLVETQVGDTSPLAVSEIDDHNSENSYRAAIYGFQDLRYVNRSQHNITIHELNAVAIFDILSNTTVTGKLRFLGRHL